MEFTICSKVVKQSSKEYKYAYDLLMMFIQENPHRIIVNDVILEDYHKIAMSNHVIKTWITGMDFKGYWKHLTPAKYKHIYIDTCKLSSEKNLIVNEKEDYKQKLYKGLEIFNKLEAIEALKPINTKTKIIQKGKGHQASIGNNSPNTKSENE